MPSADREIAAVIIRDAGPALDGLSAMREFHRAPSILVQSEDSPDMATAARAQGISDYLREPVSGEDLAAAILSAVREKSSRTNPAALAGGERLAGSSRAMSEVRGQILQLATSPCNVLITGETGTGKELAAELIHANSPRRSGRFVTVNCAAIPETLLESELFGYEKGAFTGAHSARSGQLELADGGVLFLDEVGEMSLHAQAKILRAIESKEVQRLGRRTGINVDVRIVCATNRDLQAAVVEGAFRADLFFRLNVARLQLPPLRERKEDIRQIAEHYIRELNARMRTSIRSFTEHSWRSMLAYRWPGNVRELRNAVESSLVHIPYPGMRLAELPDELHRQYSGTVDAASESEKLLAALVCHNWNRSKAAEELRWSRMTLYRKMAKYQLLSSPKAKGQTG